MSLLDQDSMLKSITKAQSRWILEEKPADIFGELLSELVELLNGEYGFIGEIMWSSEKQQKFLKAHAITNTAWNPQTRKYAERNSMEFYNLRSLFGFVIEKGTSIIANDPKNHPNSSGTPKGHPPINSFLGIPIYQGKSLIGMVGVANRPGGFSEDLIEQLKPFMTTCANLIVAFQNNEKRKVTELKLQNTLQNLEERVQQRTKELQQAKELAEKEAKVKSEFLAAMSHEIRTPLNGVLGLTELLLERGLNDEQKQYAEKIVASAQALNAIINDILDFSKIESHKLELESSEFSIQQCAEDVVDIKAFEAHSKGLQIFLVISPDIPPVLGDLKRTRQILLNLVSNAVKFTERGYVSIRVKNRHETVDSILIQFCVKDTGIGIEAHHRDKLFRPFSQCDLSTTRRYGGTGLGLAISKELCLLMGGQIEFTPRSSGGSTFWFNVEFKKAHPGVQTSRPNPPLTVLLVESRHPSSKIHSKILRNAGFNVQCVPEGSGDAILKGMAESHFQAVVFSYSLFSSFSPLQQQQFEDTCKVILLCDLLQSIHPDNYKHKGNMILIRTPLKPSQLEKFFLDMNGSTEAKRETTEALDSPFSSMRVLVVDDNEVNRIVSCQMLLRLGFHHVMVASDGIAAVHEFTKRIQAGEPIHFCLMDLQMPGLDGFSATKEIRAIEKQYGQEGSLCIIALTATATNEEREKCLSSSMNDFISKPIQKSLLHQVLLRNLKPSSK